MENSLKVLSIDVPTLIKEGEEKLKEQEEIMNNELKKSIKLKLGGPLGTFGECLGLITNYPQYRSEMVTKLLFFIKNFPEKN